MNHVTGRELESTSAANHFCHFAAWNAYEQLGIPYRSAYFLGIAHSRILEPAAQLRAVLKSIGYSIRCLMGERIERGTQTVVDWEQSKSSIYNALQVYKILQTARVVEKSNGIIYTWWTLGSGD